VRLSDPLVYGSLCGLGSALGYTAANICLRAVIASDPVWVSAVKAFPTVALFGPWLIYRQLRYKPGWPPLKPWGILVITSLFCQLCGNVMFQWALSIIGIALVVPLTLGTMIVGGAILGRIFLGEAVSRRTAMATGILIAAICLLSLGAGEASRSIFVDGNLPSFWMIAGGVAAGCLCGIAYAVLGVVIRYAVTDRVSVLGNLVTVTLTGVIALGTFSVLKIGIPAMLATPAPVFWTMMLGGLFNALAFLSLTKSLQLIPIVYVNALNATQATMAALAGILIFGESLSVTLLLGVGLTVGGLLLMSKGKLRRSRPIRASDPVCDLSEEPLAEVAESTSLG